MLYGFELGLETKISLEYYNCFYCNNTTDLCFYYTCFRPWGKKTKINVLNQAQNAESNL